MPDFARVFKPYALAFHPPGPSQRHRATLATAKASCAVLTASPSSASTKPFFTFLTCLSSRASICAPNRERRAGDAGKPPTQGERRHPVVRGPDGADCDQVFRHACKLAKRRDRPCQSGRSPDCQSEHQTTNLGVGSSNLSGRASKIRYFLQERVSQKSIKRPPRDFSKIASVSSLPVTALTPRDDLNRSHRSTRNWLRPGQRTRACATTLQTGPAELLRPTPYRFNADRAEKSGLLVHQKRSLGSPGCCSGLLVFRQLRSGIVGQHTGCRNRHFSPDAVKPESAAEP